MPNVFLYLYPIREYFENDMPISEVDRQMSMYILNKTIDRRYRQNDYQIVYATYPDSPLYSMVDLHRTDKIIWTDIDFEKAIENYKNGSKKTESEIPCPNEDCLLEQINKIVKVDKLVVGGFHFNDCVKKVAEKAYNNGIDTLVDLDLTDLFFSLYYNKSYFNPNEYSPLRYRNYLHEIASRLPDGDKHYCKLFDSPVYGIFNKRERENDDFER